MLRETGRVVAVEAGAVWVETIRSSTCGKCAARAGCGNGVLARAGEGKGLIRAIASPEVSAADCAIDDQVEIVLPEAAVLKGSVLVYLLPLLLAIVFAVVGERFGEGVSVLGFVLGIGCGFLIVHWVPALIGGPEQFEPRLAARSASEEVMIVSG